MAGVRVVGRKDLARQFGVSENVIDNMAQRGQLRKVGRNLYDYDHAMKVREAQNPAGREREMIRKAAATTPAAAPAEAKDTAGAELPPQAGAVSGTTDVLLRARTAKVLADAQMSQLALKKTAGSLIEVDKVKREATEASRLLVARLKAFPARLGPMVSTISDRAECVKVIETEVNLLIMELQEKLAAL